MKFCERPFIHAYLTTGGRVWPCPWMHYDIGNLYENDLEEIWHSDAAETARETILDGSFAYCRKISCPICERNEFQDLSEEEIKNAAIASQTPKYIAIANDRICNIACTSCRTSMYCPEKGEREKIDGVLDRLIRYANKAEVLELNGNGEFLANPSFMSFLEKLRPEKDNFRLFLQTNGILFDETHWSRFCSLSKYNLQVCVTLNSLRREVYEHLSGGFDYLDQVLKNLRFLSALRRKNEVSFLQVVMVVQECNFWEIPDYVQALVHSEEYAIDQITFRPVYKWFGMERETYWFKNMLNPLHPYHKEYLKILDDDCWNDPKVFDWGCHNIREARLHPLDQEKTFNRLLLDIYDNDKGLAPVEFIETRLERLGAKRIGIYGENEFEGTLIRLLQSAGAEVCFRLTRYENADGDIPTISMPNLQADSVDAILLLELYDQQNRINNLRALKFQGPIVNLEEFIEG